MFDSFFEQKVDVAGVTHDDFGVGTLFWKERACHGVVVDDFYAELVACESGYTNGDFTSAHYHYFFDFVVGFSGKG